MAERENHPHRMDQEKQKRLYEKHRQGAFVRSGASLFVWLFVSVSFFFGTIPLYGFYGASASAAYLVLINPPTLWLLRKISHPGQYAFFSLMINFLEIIGYTAVIYFLGGIRAAYLLPIYCALITYVGAVTPKRLPFIIAGLITFSFSAMVLMEHFGVIAHPPIVSAYAFKGVDLVLRLIMIAALLYVVAFISSYTGKLLKKNRDSIRRKNIALETSGRELEKAARDLEKKNVQLRSAIAGAKESDRMKSQFLANMSHEIRTPMNAVIGFSDLLTDTDLTDHQNDLVTTIKKSGDGLLSLINDILDFSKIEAGDMHFETIEFDPELLAYEVCDVIRPKIGSKPIEILCRIDDDLPARLKGDPLRLRQVLTNLMGNAPKFTETGEIELALGVEQQDEKRVKLHATVRDTGIGIAEEKLGDIFELFQQADGSTTRKYGGTGLGLSICKKLSNLMGGDVWVQSRLGEGSTFHFTAFLETVDKQSLQRVVPASLKSRKVLIVDDNRNNLEILGHYLKRVGVKTTALHTSQTVLSTLEQAFAGGSPFDLCILDIQMPGLCGYDVAKQIRDSVSGINILPLIALSSLMERDVENCKEVGFNGFLSKPARAHKIYRMMAHLLGDRKDGGKERGSSPFNLHTQYSVLEDMKTSVGILLAEDNPVNRKLAKMMLSKAGYQVETANNGREAVEKYTGNPGEYNLIFMDVQMPEMDGIEATRTIRQKGHNTVPIVALTAHAMKGDREMCLEAGMNDYISKPIKREVVFEIIERWVFNKKSP